VTRDLLEGKVSITRLRRGGPDAPFLSEDRRGLVAWPLVGGAAEYVHVVEFAAPGVRRGLHAHPEHEESFLVFRGALRLAVAWPIGARPVVLEVEEGDLVRMVPGVAHALRSLGPALTVHFGVGANPLVDCVPAQELAEWL